MLSDQEKLIIMLRVSFAMLVTVPLVIVAVGYVEIGIWWFVGALLGFLNLLALRFLVSTIVLAKRQNAAMAVGLLVVKMVALTAVAGALMLSLSVQPLAFAGGFGQTLMALVLGGLFCLRREAQIR